MKFPSIDAVLPPLILILIAGVLFVIVQSYRGRIINGLTGPVTEHHVFLLCKKDEEPHVWTCSCGESSVQVIGTALLWQQIHEHSLQFNVVSTERIDD